MNWAAGIVSAAVLVAVLIVRREYKLDRLVNEDLSLGHIESLELSLKATGAALDRQKEASKGMFDLLLAQQDATAILKEENARLVRELAMSEEAIHVLTPARDMRGRYSCML